MRRLCWTITIIMILACGGCAVSTPIESAEDGESRFDQARIYGGERRQIQDPVPDAELHRVFHQGSTGFTPLSAVRNSAMQRAMEFCQRDRKELYVVEEATSKPPHIMGNWPRAEIVFSCIEIADSADIAAERRARYEALRELANLHEEGLISDEEYEVERRRLLAW